MLMTLEFWVGIAMRPWFCVMMVKLMNRSKVTASSDDELKRDTGVMRRWPICPPLSMVIPSGDTSSMRTEHWSISCLYRSRSLVSTSSDLTLML